MKKTLLLLLVIANIFLFYSFSYAVSCSMNCTNGSCTINCGNIRIHWTAYNFENPYFGELTGVEGLPLTIDDFQSVEKRISQAMEKATSKKIGYSARTAPPGEMGGSIGTDAGKDNVFSTRRSISQSKAMGERVNVNYTLAFVKWLGDTRFNKPSVYRYVDAALYILDLYYNDVEAVKDLIEAFFIAQKAEEINNIIITEKMDSENKNFILANYIANSKAYMVKDLKYRYGLATSVMIMLQEPEHKELAERVSLQFKEDIENLKKMLMPNMTAEKLYKVDKYIAFAKWIADTDLKQYTHLEFLPNRYITGLAIARNIKNNEEFLNNENEKEYYIEKFKEFEKAIETKDASVKIVTVRPESIFTKISRYKYYFFIPGIFIIGFIVFRKKRIDLMKIKNIIEKIPIRVTIHRPR